MHKLSQMNAPPAYTVCGSSDSGPTGPQGPPGPAGPARPHRLDRTDRPTGPDRCDGSDRSARATRPRREGPLHHRRYRLIVSVIENGQSRTIVQRTLRL
jgi:hypothetical protein